ncbi:hypothetical protein [Enterococcus alishanensis]
MVSCLVQLLIALGFPLGEFVLGGEYIVAPSSKIMIHLIFSVVWGIVVASYLSYGGILPLKTKKLTQLIIWLNTLFVSYAIIWNFFLTTSIKETLLMGPLTLITAVYSWALIFLKSERSLCFKKSY